MLITGEFSNRRMVNSKNIQILAMGDIGLTLEKLNSVLKTHPNISGKIQLRKTSSINDAFRELVKKSGGAFLIRIDDKSTLAGFIHAFQLSTKKLNLSQTNIVIFSVREEILSSRILTQFPFLSIINPQVEGEGLAGAIIEACSSIFFGKVNIPKRQIEFASDKLIFIRNSETMNLGKVKKIDDESPIGTKVSVNALTATSAQEKLSPAKEVVDVDKKRILSACLGPKVPTFIYDPNLSWRVRGYFSKLDDKEMAITFQVVMKDGADKINETIKAIGPLFLASSSAKDSRVCSAFEFIENNGLKFKFKIPYEMCEVQRRVNPRAKITKESSAMVQFHNEKISAEQTMVVVDISLNGLGLRVDKDMAEAFLPGQFLKDVILVLNSRTIQIPFAEIRHISSSEEFNSDYKVMGLSNSGISETDGDYVDMFVASHLM